jgi:putative membrane protein
VAFALVLAAVTGVAAFNSRFLLEDVWEGVFYVGFPTVVASVATPWVDRRFGGHLSRNGSSLLALTCEMAVIAALFGAAVAVWLTPLGQEFVVDALLVALAAIFALRLLILMAVSRQSLPVASVAASIQTVVAALLLFVYSGTMRYLEWGGPVARAFLYRPEEAPVRIQQLQYIDPGKFAMLATLCVLYAGAVWLFLRIVDIPWQRALGVSVLDFVRGFVGHMAEGSRELETFFEEIGEDAIVPITVLSFRRPDGDEKARFVLPMLHPGPMGDIGGGNLPRRIAEASDGLAFPPHATAGHDFNLVTRREVETVIDTVVSAYQRIEYESGATRSVRIEEGEATLTAQAFGDSALAVTTFSPSCTDDIMYSVGLSTAAEARATGLNDVMVVDAHNCNDSLDGGDLGHVVPGDTKSFDMMDAAKKAGTLLGKMDRSEVELGVAWDESPWDAGDGIGPLGIRVAVIRVDGQRSAYVLVDGNNMVPGLRERIVDQVDGVDTVEVMTTDTHVVNDMEAENQVGEGVPHGELIDEIQTLVDRATADLEPVEAGMVSETAEVTIFGNDRTEMLASTANAAISMGAPLAAAIVIASLAVSVVIFSLM